MSFLVIISSTDLSLWNNKIPNEIYNYIYLVDTMYKTQVDIHKMTRHHPLLIKSFRYFYGNNLESCNYAGLIKLNTHFLHFYEVKHIACYLSAYYPECIDLNLKQWLIFKLNTINNNNSLSEKMKNFHSIEAYTFAKRQPFIFVNKNIIES
jgi:hypothetical protein